MSLLHIDLAKEVGKAIEQVLKSHLEHFDDLHKVRQLLEELVAIEQRREAAAMQLPPPSAVQRRGYTSP